MPGPRPSRSRRRAGATWRKHPADRVPAARSFATLLLCLSRCPRIRSCSRLVPSEERVDGRAISLEHRGTATQPRLARIGQRVHAARRSIRPCFPRRRDQTLLLELTQRSVDTGHLDLCEAHAPQVLLDEVAMGLLCGDREEDVRHEQVTGAPARCALLVVCLGALGPPGARARRGGVVRAGPFLGWPGC